MKSLLYIFTFFSFVIISDALGNGVGVINASTNQHLKLISSQVTTTVEGQISVTVATQTFKNTFLAQQNFVYAFPMREEASATNLRWYLNGEWHQAVISPTPQDSTLPGGGTINYNLQLYLGETPLFFPFEDPLLPDSSIKIELTFVELLPYEFGNVEYLYPNDYSLIQSEPLDVQNLQFTLVSQRTIDSIKIIGLTPGTMTNDGHTAFIEYNLYESPAVDDYNIIYSLNLSELGLYSYSTFEPDSLVPDELSNGYMVFVAEPDPTTNTDLIHKVFTLIVDRSGSMYGTKMVQARNAADFIVNNLNEGDKFNIVDFSDNISSFMPGHVEYNETTRQQALNYISQFEANGSTNISGAFDTAVPQFNAANDSTANIIIFFTDGQATWGITETTALVDHINQLIQQTETNIILFTFGIGLDVNYQLLTLLASDNNGIAKFLENNQLEEEITHFYLMIRNPVLLNSQISFLPAVIDETYPDPLPNLYKGSQMIVAGRYSTPAPLQITLTGEIYGQPVEYQYNVDLVDSSVQSNRFIPKIWAKRKIENLLIQYYSLDPYSPEALALKEQIIQVSLQYGIITPFTSFGNPTLIDEDNTKDKPEQTPEGYSLLGNYPNPFNPTTTIRFMINKDLHKIVWVRIYNSLGELVKVLYVNADGKGTYDIVWDGTLQNGSAAPSDVYIYVVDFGDAVLASKMLLLK